MMGPPGDMATRREAYGEHRVSAVDRFGVWLSSRAIARSLGGRRDLDALDLGCGYHAALLRVLRSRLRSGVGVDVRIAPEARADPLLSFVETTIEDALPAMPDGSFDLILFISVLEHLWRPVWALEHCRRLLRTDGLLLVNVPTWRGKIFLEYSAFRLGTSPAIEMDDHKMYYDKRDLWPLLIAAGFKPSRARLKYHKFGLNLFAIVRA
jgi:SAM-dependent methyltransferase